MLMKKIILIILTLIFPLIVFSQDKSIKKAYKQADNLILLGDLEKAIEKYKDIIAKYPDNSNYNYKIGFIYFEATGMRDNAKEFLLKASENVSTKYVNSYKETTAPIETWYYLALLYHYGYEFDKAKEYFNKYIESSTDEVKIEEVKGLIKACDNGIDLVINPLDLDVIELGGNINSKYEEHSPLITADLKTLIFTSKRKGTGGNKDEYGDYYEDIYISHFENGDWTEPESISTNINTDDHEASSGLSYDGRTLFIYEPSNMGDIYVSYLQNDVWSKPESLGPYVNTEYRETHATTSIDGQTLYFTSQRPGGFGGSDIYVSKMEEDGSWGLAQNIGGEINTPLDEEGPYIHPSDTIMYFSSNGHPGMGGYDLFITVLNKEGVWSEPKNIGYPLNSPDDDVFFITSPEGNYGFYASNQYGASGSTNIYTLKLPSQFKSNLAVLSGNIVLNEGDGGVKYSDISIKVIDNETGDTIRSYKPDPINGLYTLVLPTPKDYTIVYEAYGHLPRVETVNLTSEADLYNMKTVLPLQPITFGSTAQEYSVSFDPSTNELTYEGNATLNSMAKNVNTYDEIIAQVIVPNKDEILLNQQKETILSYLYRNVVDTSKIKIIEQAEDDNFEIFLADTSFLNFSKTKWNIEFDENEKLDLISEYKLDQIAYYLKNDKSMCIQIPVYQNTDKTINKERTQDIYDYIVQKESSVAKQLIVWQVPEGTNAPSEKSLELVVTNKYPGAITLVKVLSEMKTEEKIENNQCVLQKLADEAIAYTLYFDFGKAIAENISSADDVIDCLKENSDIKVELKGHTDDIGSNEINYTLGLKRAEYLKQYFVKEGVNLTQITVTSDGETKPVAPNSLNGADNPDGRKLNRRVEIIVKK